MLSILPKALEVELPQDLLSRWPTMNEEKRLVKKSKKNLLTIQQYTIYSLASYAINYCILLATSQET